MNPGTSPRRPAATLWDRSRRAVIAEVVDTALALFAEQGYEATTIAQIASRAGVSQRSLFRYFGSKEDLVCGAQDELGELLLDTVAAQPPDASAWDALRAGFIAISSAQHTVERVLEITTLIFANPLLRARYLEKRLAWRASLVPVVVGVLFTLLHALIQAYVLTLLTTMFYGELNAPLPKKEKPAKA